MDRTSVVRPRTEARLAADRNLTAENEDRGMGYAHPPSLFRPTNTTHRRNGYFFQAFLIGSATNLIASAVFTRSRTVFLPAVRASLRALRTSAVFATALPPTSRITSPVLMPRSAAGPLGSTPTTATPCSPEPATSLAGARLSPSRGESPFDMSSLVSAFACFSLGIWPRVRVRVLLSPLRAKVTLILVPGAII